jgi:WD40 repeat protein
MAAEHIRSVNSAAFSPDGQRIVTASTDATVRIWDVKNLYNISEISLLKGHSRQQSVRHAEFSPDGLSIVSASSDKTLRIWDAATNAKPRITQAHGTKAVQSIEVSRDGRKFVTVADDGTAKVWTFGPTGVPSPAAELPSNTGGGVAQATFGRMNDNVVVSTKSGDVLIWDPGTNIFPWSSVLASAGDGNAGQPASEAANIVVTEGTKEKEPEIWNVQTREHRSLKGPPTGEKRGVELSSDGTLVVSVSGNVARLWNAATGEMLRPLDDTGVRSAHFSPDGESVVTTSLNRTVRVWDVSSGEEILQLRGHETDVNGARFSVDGKRIVSASSDLSVRVWDRETGAQIVRFAVKDDAMDATFSADGNSVIAALHDGTVQVFDVRWTTAHGDDLVGCVCAAKLPKAKSLTADDGLVPFLSRYVGLDACDRRGVLVLVLNFFSKTVRESPSQTRKAGSRSTIPTRACRARLSTEPLTQPALPSPPKGSGLSLVRTSCLRSAW